MRHTVAHYALTMQHEVAHRNVSPAIFALEMSPPLGKLSRMSWAQWRERAEQSKFDASKTDAELAADISELLGYEISRATVNHWFRGRRTPSIDEFMMLCASLGADPGHVLMNVPLTAQRLAGAPTTAFILREPGAQPPYISKQAERLRRFKAKRRKIKVRG